MTKLIINDLEMTQELTGKALQDLRGGATQCEWRNCHYKMGPTSGWRGGPAIKDPRPGIKPYIFYSYMRLGG